MYPDPPIKFRSNPKYQRRKQGLALYVYRYASSENID